MSLRLFGKVEQNSEGGYWAAGGRNAKDRWKMTEQKSEKEVNEKAIKLIPPTGEWFAEGFDTLAKNITKELNKFAERQKRA